MVRSSVRVCLSIVVSSFLLSTMSIAPIKAQCSDTSGGRAKREFCGQFHRGAQALRNGQYEAAAAHFQQAIDFDPASIDAYLYLATAYVAQYVPGRDSEDNHLMALKAMDAAETVLRKDSSNARAVTLLANLYVNMNEFERAKEYYLLLTQIEPSKPESFWSVGQINWIMIYNKQNPLPISRRRELIEEGLEYLQKAIEIDSRFSNAFFYINLLYRQKAQAILDEAVENNVSLKGQLELIQLDPRKIDQFGRMHVPDRYAEYANYLKTADEYFAKSLALRRAVQNEALSKTSNQTRPSAGVPPE
jgi:tetratricopeptide (TPR) repeat protein